MGPSSRSNSNQRQQNITTGKGEGDDVTLTDGIGNQVQLSVASKAARGSFWGSLSITSRKPALSQPIETHEATHTQLPAPDHCEVASLVHAVCISTCRDLHAGHGEDNSNTFSEDAHAESKIPVYQTSKAEITSSETTNRMDDQDVEPPKLYYQRMPGMDRQLQYQGSEEMAGPGEEGILMVMMRESKVTPKVKDNTSGSELRDATSVSRERHEDKDLPNPTFQQIPQPLLQVVTPPDSKIAHNLIEDTATTARPSPSPAPIASRHFTSTVALTASHRLPQTIGLATPEYTFVTHLPITCRNLTNSITRTIHREPRAEGRGFTPKLESFTDWSENPSPQSCNERIRNRTQLKTSKGHTPQHRRNTLPDPDTTDHFLHEHAPAPAPSAAVKGTENIGTGTKQATHDPSVASVVVHGFDCPPENYIRQHFTKEALRCRWEVSQSYTHTHWPKLRNPNREGPVVPFNDMEDSCGVFSRQRL